MALELVWTKRAEMGYQEVIEHLQRHWTDREIKNFVAEADAFFNLLTEFPELLQKSSFNNQLRRGPMNKHTMVTYRYWPKKRQIQLLNIRATRKKPI